MDVKDLAKVAREYREAEEVFWRTGGKWELVHAKRAKLDRCIASVLDDGLPIEGTVGEGGKVTFKNDLTPDRP